MDGVVGQVFERDTVVAEVDADVFEFGGSPETENINNSKNDCKKRKKGASSITSLMPCNRIPFGDEG